MNKLQKIEMPIDGEFRVNWKTLVCMESSGKKCIECYFRGDDEHCCHLACNEGERSDGKDVVFKEIIIPNEGEIVEINGIKCVTKEVPRSNGCRGCEVEGEDCYKETNHIRCYFRDDNKSVIFKRLEE